MVTVEQTEQTETGLDVRVVAPHGATLAWCYTTSAAQGIADALNNFWRHGDGEARCTGCHPIAPKPIKESNTEN